jgi:hypothetical protein
MTLEQQVLLLTRIVRLIDEMQKSDNFLGKDDVISHLRWSSEHVSREIWARTIHKDYGAKNND